MENGSLIFLDNVQIKEKENVTIEIEIDEMIEKFKKVIIKITYKNMIVKIDEYKRRV